MIRTNSQKKLNIIFSLSLLVIIVFVVSFIFIKVTSNKLTFAYYDVPENIQSSVTQLIKSEFKTSKNKPLVNFIVLDSSLSLEAQLAKKTKIDAIITLNGLNATSILNNNSKKNRIKLIAPDTSVIENTPTSIRQSVKLDNKYYATPLLLDHFEINFNILDLRTENLSEVPQKINTFENYLLKTKDEKNPMKQYPLGIAGADDSTLLMLVSALTESLYGYDSYKMLVSEIISHDSFENIQAIAIGQTSTGENITLSSVLNVINNWRDNGCIHPQWYTLTNKDIETFMEFDIPSTMMSLSNHRKIYYKIISKYKESFFPNGHTGSNRSIVAPLYVGLVISDKKVATVSASDIVNYLCTDFSQKTLSNETGLAPVTYASETKDLQSTNVRLWAASADMPIPSIAEAAFTSTEKRTSFTNAIREYLSK